MDGRRGKPLDGDLFQMISKYWALIIALVIVVQLACLSSLPDDLPSLILAMNSGNETTSVDATLKVLRTYGKAGLLKAVSDGQNVARSRAAFRLREFPERDVVEVLTRVATDDADGFVRTQALWSLGEIGTLRELPAIERAMNDTDPIAADMAREAASAIRARSKP
jgi:hypothetical protein